MSQQNYHSQGEQGRSQADDCSALLELLPAYALGATDADETAFVEAMLPRCPEASAELNQYEALGEALLYAVPPAVPPADLGQRIMAAAAPRPAVIVRPNSIRFAPHWSAIAAAAALVLLVLTNVFWLAQVNTLREREAQIVALVQRQENALIALGADDTRRVELAATAPDGDAAARVLWNPRYEVALLTASDLPTLPEDRIYQLWLIEGERMVGAGLFRVETDGSGVLIFEPPEAIEDFEALGVTEEPEGGSLAPTTSPIIVGEV